MGMLILVLLFVAVIFVAAGAASLWIDRDADRHDAG